MEINWKQTLRRVPSKYKRALVLLLLLGIVGVALLKIPRWQVSRVLARANAIDRFMAENEARRTLAQILLALGGGVALYVAWRRVKVAHEGQITERFTKAIEQLASVDSEGNPALEVRLGGIYALERIARDSERDHWTVMEVLTAYVRKNAPWKKAWESNCEVSAETGETPIRDRQPSGEPYEPRTDIQAILTVLGRRALGETREGNRSLDLRVTDLRGTDLRDAHLENAYLWHAHLEGATLGSSHGRLLHSEGRPLG